MRPPDLPGGNVAVVTIDERTLKASMRPPDLPGGNPQQLLAAEAVRLKLQ